MSNPIVITRDTVSRPWTEVEPKIFIALITGFLALVALFVAKSLGITLAPELQEVVPFAFAILCGYFTKSTGTTITRDLGNGNVNVEAHTAATVTTVTNSIPVQVPSRRGSFTEVLSEPVPDPKPVENKTEVLPPSSAFAAARGYSAPVNTDDTH